MDPKLMTPDPLLPPLREALERIAWRDTPIHPRGPDDFTVYLPRHLVLGVAAPHDALIRQQEARIAELEAENQQLRAERDRFAKDREDVVVALGKHAHPGLSPAGSVVDLARENERLREELAPFLELARDAASEVADGMGRGIKMVERLAARHKEE